jgi:hypothetical protein
VNDAEFPNSIFSTAMKIFSTKARGPNSKIKVNGFGLVERYANFTLLPGVTLDLKDAAPGKISAENSGKTQKSIKGKVQGHGAKLNEVLGFVRNQNKLDKEQLTRAPLSAATSATLEYVIAECKLPLETSSAQCGWPISGGFQCRGCGILHRI